MSHYDPSSRVEVARFLDQAFLPFGTDAALSTRGSSILADLLGTSGRESDDIGALRAVQRSLADYVPTTEPGWHDLMQRLGQQLPIDSVQWATDYWRSRLVPETPTILHQPAAGPSATGPQPAVIDESNFDPPTVVHQVAPVLATPMAQTTPRPVPTGTPTVPPAPPAPNPRNRWYVALAIAVLVAATGGVYAAWLIARPDSGSTTEQAATAVPTANPTPGTGDLQPATAVPTIPPAATPPPPAVVVVTCAVSTTDVEVQQEFTVTAAVTPPDASVSLLFRHGDGGTAEVSPHQAFYFYPGQFRMTLEWETPDDGGVQTCGTMSVTGTPIGYRTCDADRAPNPSSRYRVNVPDDPDDPDSGLVVRFGPGVDKPFLSVLPPDAGNVRVTGCWQPESGLNPWWQIDGGGWSSSCCLVEQ